MRRQQPRKKSNISLGEDKEKLGDQPEVEVKELPNRIFLYLQPKIIHYSPETDDNSVEIELTHPELIITTLKDHFTTQNIIYLDEYKIEATTFSVTIKQDDVDDLNSISDTPITLTLYENIPRPIIKAEQQDPLTISAEISTKSVASIGVEEEGEIGENSDELIIIERRHVAQGFLDLLEFITNRRFRASTTTFLYPLPNSIDHRSCKIEWEVYSLLPPIKNVVLSNAAFLHMSSLYNLEDNLMDDCDDMTVRLSFISTMPNENNKYDKVFICSYGGFLKQTISQQCLNIKWENLKDSEKENLQTMCINSDLQINLARLFKDRLPTEGVELNVEDIDITTDNALICNALHRFVLTDEMENILESVLACNQQHLILELVRARAPEKVLLQGFVELDVFMYPEIANCPYTIELRPPGYQKTTLPKPKDSVPKVNQKKTKARESASSIRRQSSVGLEGPKEKIPFATLRICLSKPITEPRSDLMKVTQPDMKQTFIKCDYNIYSYETPDLAKQREINYRVFDERIGGIVDYMISNNIKTIEDDREFYCNQLGNMNNRILKLVACDFNERIKTTTNMEFTNLMTVVYKELEQRIHNITMKSFLKPFPHTNDMDRCTIFKYFTIIKLMYELGINEVAEFFVKKLDEAFLKNCNLAFYKFIYNLETEHFDEARKYLDQTLSGKEMEGEILNNLITLYVNNKQDLIDPEKSMQYANENLLNTLTTVCVHNIHEISVWILLFCIYKRQKYLPGMEYCRWNYENLYKSSSCEIPFMPTSRWDIYMAHKLEFKSLKGQHFYKLVNLLNSVGLYQFAEWVFDEIANEAMEVEKYFFYSTFNILLNVKLEPKFKVKNFPVEKFLNPVYLRAMLSQVNGNLEYFRAPSGPESANHYSTICELKFLDNPEHFHLGLFRYSYRMMEEYNFEKARDGYSLCFSGEGSSIVAAIGKGKACYKLGDLDEAEKAFALSTHYGVHLPNVWAYLALINLRKGENFKALECWKYARLNPQDVIHAEVVGELSKIDCEDVDLFIDVPENNADTV